MNFHLFIVHFPIVLLTIYVILEVCTRFFWVQNQTLQQVKQRSLWLGTIAVFLSLSTGEDAEKIVWKSPIVHLHEEFADRVRNIFVIISLIMVGVVWQWTTVIQSYYAYYKKMCLTLHKRYVTTILAVVWFVLLAGVWALGWAITRGTSHDIIAQIILQWAGISQ